MIYSFTNITSHSIFYVFFFFPYNIMADVASKQQTTALFLSTIVTRTRRHTVYNNNNNNLLLLLLVVVVVVLVVLVQYRQKKPTHLCKISRYTNRVHLFISLVIASSL